MFEVVDRIERQFLEQARYFNLFGERSDMDDMIRALRIAREIYNTEPQKNLIGEEMMRGTTAKSDAELEQAIRKLVHNRQHPLGTCAIGTGPKAVVDEDLRVHGLTGLRVVDAFVIPDQLGGNINIPTIMIAEKASDLIRERALPAV